MSTVRDLITDSLKELGAIGIGETPTADEIQDGLTVLNNLLDTWRTESLMVYGINENVFPYVGGQNVYTIGIGGDFNMERPQTIESAFNRQVGTSSTNDYKIFTTNNYEVYADIVAKNVPANLVFVLWYNAGVPLGTITCWPTPTDSNFSLVLWTWQVIQEFTSIDDEIVLPRGYKRALTFNLAIDLSGRYGRNPMASTISGAIESKAQLKRMNTVVPLMSVDPAIGGNQNYCWNYLTGGY